jgi:hypothetical protein
MLDLTHGNGVMSQWQLPMSNGNCVLGPRFLVAMKESSDYIRLIKVDHNQMSMTHHVIDWKIYLKTMDRT